MKSKPRNPRIAKTWLNGYGRPKRPTASRNGSNPDKLGRIRSSYHGLTRDDV